MWQGLTVGRHLRAILCLCCCYLGLATTASAEEQFKSVRLFLAAGYNTTDYSEANLQRPSASVAPFSQSGVELQAVLGWMLFNSFLALEAEGKYTLPPFSTTGADEDLKFIYAEGRLRLALPLVPQRLDLLGHGGIFYANMEAINRAFGFRNVRGVTATAAVRMYLPQGNKATAVLQPYLSLSMYPDRGPGIEWDNLQKGAGLRLKFLTDEPILPLSGYQRGIVLSIDYRDSDFKIRQGQTIDVDYKTVSAALGYEL